MGLVLGLSDEVYLGVLAAKAFFLYVLGSSHWTPGGGLGNGDRCVCPYAVMMPSSFRLGKHAAPGVDMETTSTVGHLNQIAATFL